MAKYSIISKDKASVRHIGCPRYSGSYMGVGILEFSEISSPSPISWEIGDFVDYRNKIYRLYSLPEPKKQARKGEYGAAFVYTGVQFHSPVKELEIALFRDVVTEDNDVHFSTLPDVSTFEDVYGIARRIQECMNDLYPNRWRIEVYQSDDEELNTLLSETKEFSLNEGTCLDALNLIYDIWENVGWIHTTEGDKEVITIARANVRDVENTTDSFAYGKGNGLTAIRRASANKDEFATRLYVYGSDRNLPPRYYNSKNIKDAESVNIPNLMLPIETWGVTDGLPDPRFAYLEADEEIVRKYGLIPRVIRFDGNGLDEIYPSIEGLTESQVRKAMTDLGFGSSQYLPLDSEKRIDEVESADIPKGKGTLIKPDGTPVEGYDVPSSSFLLYLRGLGFGLEEQAVLANEKNAIISMKSGKCAGREFVVKSSSWEQASGKYMVRLERLYDESLNRYFPNDDYPIVEGDRFVILDIAMPEYYVVLAQKRLYEEGMKILADYTRTSAYYEPQIDAKAMYENGIIIREGMYMKVVDEDVVETDSKEDFVLIDTLSIDEKTEIPTYSVTLREQKRAARGLAALEDMIEDSKEDTEKELREQKQYTQRRFSSALDTISMLQNAFSNFSGGINPVTVQTMALLIGDESLQFKFTSSAGSNALKTPVTYDSGNRVLKIARAYRIWHMTLGIDSVTAPSGRSNDDYLKWSMPTWSSSVLDDGTKSYYLYAKVERDGTSGDYVLSEQSIAMEAESGYYHLLVGVLNREYDGTREFVPLHGFTEVLPGQITTDVIKSADGNSVLDLVRGVLTFGELVGLSGHTEEAEKNLRIWAGTGESEKENAPFRVYDDGSVNASLLNLLKGCKIGKLTITEDGIHVDTTSGGGIDINQSGVTAIQKDGSLVSLGTCGSQAITINGKDAASGQCYFDEDTYKIAAQINAAEGYHAIHCLGGVYAGLRPNIRKITSSSSLTELDHTIILSNPASITLTLPRYPQTGQTYKLIHTTNMDVMINATGSVINAATGTTVGGITERTTLTLTYFDGVWYAEFK